MQQITLAIHSLDSVDGQLMCWITCPFDYLCEMHDCCAHDNRFIYSSYAVASNVWFTLAAFDVLDACLPMGFLVYVSVRTGRACSG